uniref:Galectin domain-containing protein n=1 Tax=Anolis carolinensis TaxID=28377 RepID=A0A803TW96_ANOCA
DQEDPSLSELCCKPGSLLRYLILHFNPLFDLHGDTTTIVCNSKREGERHEEHARVRNLQYNSMVCFLPRDKVTMKLPEGQELKFTNQLGLETAK